MTEQEYKTELERIKQMRHDLERRYVESSTNVKAPNLVELNGEILYLKKYVVVSGGISPTLYPVSKNLKGHYADGKVYRNNWREMKLYKPSKLRANDG